MQSEELAKLRQVVADGRERDERRRLADRAAYDRLRRGFAAAKAADTPGAVAAEMRVAQGHLKPWDLVRIFEAKRTSLQQEAAAAAADAASARAQLARAQVRWRCVGGLWCLTHPALLQCCDSVPHPCRRRCTLLACTASSTK